MYSGIAATDPCGKAVQGKAGITLMIVSSSDNTDGVHAMCFTLSQLAIMTS